MIKGTYRYKSTLKIVGSDSNYSTINGKHGEALRHTLVSTEYELLIAPQKNEHLAYFLSETLFQSADNDQIQNLSFLHDSLTPQPGSLFTWWFGLKGSSLIYAVIFVKMTMFGI